MNVKERQIECVISTEKDLEELVRQALVSGVLDLENCRIDVDFNLAELLVAVGQEQVPSKNATHVFTVECPFLINTTSSDFTKTFCAFYVDTAVIFLSKTDFSDTTFSDKAVFNFATFSGESVFSRAKFSSEAYFDGSNFSGKMYFDDTVFKERAYFDNTIFSSESDFMDATFSGKASFENTTFLEGAYFCSTIFQGDLNFCEALFQGETNFMRANFQGETDFRDTTFAGQVIFWLATFSEKADFHASTFSGESDFEKATFEKHTSFKEIKILGNVKLNFDHIKTYDYFGIIPTVFNGEIIIDDPALESDKRSLVVDLGFLFKAYLTKGKITFQGVEIDNDRTCLKVRNLKKDSNVEVHFQDCGFYGKNVAFTNVAMKQVFIQDGNYVSGMAFYHCKWDSKKALGFFQFIPFWLKFRAFDGLKTEDILKKAESYGNLKVSALDAGDAQLSNDFHFWHQLYQNKWFSWNTFYLWTSAYGLSSRLPLIFFIAVFFTFDSLYLWLFKQPLESQYLVSLSASIPFVFNDVETIKGAIDAMTKIENVKLFYGLYILQHLIQGYLLFQIGAAIRNKVKR